MSSVHPLPGFLVQRFRDWQAISFKESRGLYERLATEGQHPRAMVVSCCDSRVNASRIFQAGPGDLFVHRNIANLVPPYEPDSGYHGTSAAVEYAVTVLRVASLVVLGHSQCGGVKGCIEICSKKKADLGPRPASAAHDSFVAKWMEILRPGYDNLASKGGNVGQRALEHEGIRLSLANLWGFPFVAEAVKSGHLSLHGCWHDFGKGELWDLNPDTGEFTAL